MNLNITTGVFFFQLGVGSLRANANMYFFIYIVSRRSGLTVSLFKDFEKSRCDDSPSVMYFCRALTCSFRG